MGGLDIGELGLWGPWLWLWRVILLETSFAV